MRKICFLLPGGWEHTNQKRYTDIKQVLKRSGFTVVPVNQQWKYRTMSHWRQQFIDTYTKKARADDYICALGFSFGAFIALIASDELRIDTLILCSLSPYFKEDMSELKKLARELGIDAEKALGKRRMADFRARLFRHMPQRPACHTFLLYGESEPVAVVKRAKAAHQTLQDTTLIAVPEAGHDITDPTYHQTLERVIKDL